MHSYISEYFVPQQIASLPSSTHRNVSNTSGNRFNPTPARPVSLPDSRMDSSSELPRDISSRFGLRLREMRRAHNMTQLRMAVDFGIDRSFISDVERGRKSISLHMLEVIALGMKVSLSDLFSGI